MYSLGKRLRLIASLVPDGAKVCDVGTDHGYLPASLYMSGRVASVIATDINEKPLSSALENFKALDLADKIPLVLCNGLSDIEPSSVDTVIIAGMGGEVIVGILERTPFLKKSDCLLILQPMTAAEVLHDYLALNGFNIEAEPTVEEGGRCYAVIKARYDGCVRDIDAVYHYVGKISPSTESDMRYITRQYKRCADCAAALENIQTEKNKYLEYLIAANEIKHLLEENNGI